MIESITMSNVASFNGPTPVSIETNKKVTLLYGHNGSGKSTIGRYLQNPDDIKFNTCSHILKNANDYQILVYNTDFIEKNFSQSSFEGIFTLGENNVDAENKIKECEIKLEEIEKEINLKKSSIEKHESTIDLKTKSIKDKVFSLKRNYEKKDLDHCLDNVKTMQSFYEKLIRTSLIEKPDYTFESLAEEARILQDKNTQVKLPLPPILFLSGSIEDNIIFKETIISSNDSYFSELVEKLKSLNWINQGRKFLDETEEKCPFCQQEIDEEIKENISALFDQSYNNKTLEILNLKDDYETEISKIKNLLDSENHKEIKNKDFSIKKEETLKILLENITKIEKKSLDPSIKVELTNTSVFFESLNLAIDNENKERIKLSQKITKKKESLNLISRKFWSLARIKFDDDITNFDIEIEAIQKTNLILKNNKEKLKVDLEPIKEIRSSNQSKITNIKESIININNQILNIGLSGFEIKKKAGDNNHYYLCREETESESEVYKTLSEGEKTLITYLYFLEICQGSTSSEEIHSKNKKIIIVDDPISSLSHNYVYEIATLTHKKLIKGFNYSQLLILTHNLYFLHEIIKFLPLGTDEKTDPITRIKTKEDRFDKKCNLYRVSKNPYSNILKMKRDEIKNDYQSYWQIIKDAKSGNVNKIILPNTMRNILEYYFSFTQKSDKLKEELVKLEDENNEFTSFFRYINRGSHFDSINITDLEHIDPSRFIEKFREIFIKTDFEEHYDRMMAWLT